MDGVFLIDGEEIENSFIFNTLVKKEVVFDS